MTTPITVVVIPPTPHSVVVVPPVQITVVPAGQGLQGVRGPKGDAGTAVDFPYTQAITSSVWTVPHNLGRYPSVTATDHLGNLIHGDVLYVDNNIVQITHGAALTGFVYCN